MDSFGRKRDFKSAVANVLLLIVCAAFVTAFMLGVEAQQFKLGEKPGGGKIVELPVNKLPKFKDPIPKPPKQEPPQKPGGRWHWHPHHSWIWFPQNIAPRNIVLEPNYRLPQQVYFYQQPSGYYVICPHCGQTILVE